MLCEYLLINKIIAKSIAFMILKIYIQVLDILEHHMTN